MKRILFSVVFIISISFEVSSQTEKFKLTPTTEIFTDFHYNLSDTSRRTGFDLNRAHLGYEISPGGNISSTVIVNIGTPDDLANGSEPRRYAYCREASISWSETNLTVTMGITSTRIFGFQQKYWGKRYIAKPYQAINGYGYVADLGIAVDYKINDRFSADFTLMNGEGYSNLQMDNNLKTSVGLIYTPDNLLTFRLYADIQRVSDLRQVVMIGFAGIKTKLITFGGEVSFKSNMDEVKDHDAWGLSATGAVKLNEMNELFGRIDYISSVVLPNNALKWNFMNDGTFIVAGLQRTLNEYVKIAFNYQGNYPYSTNGMVSDLLYLNAMFKF